MYVTWEYKSFCKCEPRVRQYAILYWRSKWWCRLFWTVKTCLLLSLWLSSIGFFLLNDAHFWSMSMTKQIDFSIIRLNKFDLNQFRIKYIPSLLLSAEKKSSIKIKSIALENRQLKMILDGNLTWKFMILAHLKSMNHSNRYFREKNIKFSAFQWNTTQYIHEYFIGFSWMQTNLFFRSCWKFPNINSQGHSILRCLKWKK